MRVLKVLIFYCKVHTLKKVWNIGTALLHIKCRVGYYYGCVNLNSILYLSLFLSEDDVSA